MKTRSAYMENTRSIALHPPVARAFGDRPALILQQIRYWMDLNQIADMQYPADKRMHFKDGRWWVFNTYDEWKRANFDFWSKRTIERHIKDLENRGVLIAESFNKGGGDMTRWYTIDFDVMDRLIAEAELQSTPSRQSVVMPITSICRNHDDKMAQSIYIDSESTTENTSIELASPDGAQVAASGETLADTSAPIPDTEPDRKTAATEQPFEIGASVVWAKEERGGYGYVHYIPVKVVRYTSKRVSVGWTGKNGMIKTSHITVDRLFATETEARAKISGLKKLADLTPLQQVIGNQSFGLRGDQAITGNMATRINLVVSELNARFGTNGQRVTDKELKAAYTARLSQNGAIAPSDPVKVGVMVGEYRKTHTPTRPAAAVALPDPDCPHCGGLGRVKADVPPGHPDYTKTFPCPCTQREREVSHE